MPRKDLFRISVAMPLDPNLPADVYICYGVERGTKFSHWMLMIRSRDSAYGTWLLLHRWTDPEYSIPSVASHGIESPSCWGRSAPRIRTKVNAAAQRVPAQQCQRYIVTRISELEHRGLLPPRRAAVQLPQVALGYVNRHPRPQPSFLLGTVQPTYSSCGTLSNCCRVGVKSFATVATAFTPVFEPVVLSLAGTVEVALTSTVERWWYLLHCH